MTTKGMTATAITTFSPEMIPTTGITNRTLSRDEKEFSRLYDTYSGLLLASIKKMVGCTLTSEDILQNSFIKIWCNSDRYCADKGTIYTWMLRIARNETIDYLRSKSCRKSQVTMTINDEMTVRSSCSDLVPMMSKDIDNSLSRLPQQERSILDLYRNGFTCKEIATLMGMPEGTIKTKMRRSYGRLRLLMAS